MVCPNIELEMKWDLGIDIEKRLVGNPLIFRYPIRHICLMRLPVASGSGHDEFV